MKRHIQITSEEQWLKDRESYITSTETAALFGCEMASTSTAFELYHIKRGDLPKPEFDDPFLTWGRRLESVIAEGVAEDNGWELRPLDVFAVDDEYRLGSSFDYIATDDDGDFLLEIKSTSFSEYMKKFIEDDEKDDNGLPVFIEAPAYYEIQVQTELEAYNDVDGVDNIERACLCVFIADTRQVKLIWRDRNKDMGNRIKEKAKWFWESKTPPSPNLEKDADLIASLHRANNKDSAYDGTEDSDFDIDVMSYIQESENEKRAKLAKDRLKSKIILAMGEHNSAWCNTGRVANKKSFRVTESK